MNMLIMIIVLTALSGIGGTGIGAALSSTVKKSSNKAMSLLLSFASGTMISIVCLDLFHDALETGMSKGGIALFVIIGFLTVYLLERVMDEKAKRAKSRMSRKMMTAGIAMMFAVACHNIPVGMTIGASAISHGGLIGSPAMTLAVLSESTMYQKEWQSARPFGSGYDKGKSSTAHRLERSRHCSRRHPGVLDRRHGSDGTCSQPELCIRCHAVREFR